MYPCQSPYSLDYNQMCDELSTYFCLESSVCISLLIIRENGHISSFLTNFTSQFHYQCNLVINIRVFVLFIAETWESPTLNKLCCPREVKLFRPRPLYTDCYLLWLLSSFLPSRWFPRLVIHLNANICC